MQVYIGICPAASVDKINCRFLNLMCFHNTVITLLVGSQAEILGVALSNSGSVCFPK